MTVPTRDRPSLSGATRRLNGHPRFLALVAGLAAGAGAASAAGPVAGLIAGVYGGIGVRAFLRQAAGRRAAAAQTVALDAVGALAADLRAGAAPADALAELIKAFAPWSLERADHDAARPQVSTDARLDAVAQDSRNALVSRAAGLVVTASRVGERLGAPLADLLDRVDEDLRAAVRGRAGVEAQMAGVRATTWILAGLPAAGVALGYGMGGDPLRVLLHTNLGAGCAIGALSLQCAGIAWTGRLCGGAVAEFEPTAARRPRAAGRCQGWDAWARHLAAAVVGLAVVATFGGWFGVVAGAASVGAVEWMGSRRAPATTRRQRRHAAADLPVAADLIASALRVGAPPEVGARVVGAALGGPVGQRLRAIATALRAGAPPAEAWAHLSDLAGADRLVRAAVRSSESGAALSGALARVAGDLRAGRTAAAEACAHRVGVLVVLPLGMCFLPAFLLAGVVPVVFAVLGEVLGAQ